MKKIALVAIPIVIVFLLLVVMVMQSIITAIFAIDEKKSEAGEFDDILIPITVTGKINNNSISLKIEGDGVNVSGIKGTVGNGKFTAKTKDSGNGMVTMELPKDANPSMKSWMPQFDQSLYSYQLDHNSRQYIFNKTCKNKDGFRMSGNSYLIALGSYYGKTIGTKYKISFKQSDGSILIIDAVLGDQKADKDTDPKHQYHLSDKSIIEFIMAKRSSSNSTLINNRFGTIVGISKGDSGANLTGTISGEKIEITGDVGGLELTASGTVKNGKVEASGMLGNISGYGGGSYGGGKFLWPVPGYMNVSSGYGWRICPFHGREFHAGIDIPAPKGTPVIASAPGKVIESGNKGGFGKYIMIDHGGGTYSSYAHNSKLIAKKGQTVKAGEVIAQVGTTGSSTGNHLDYRTYSGGVDKHVNPATFLNR